MVTHESTDLLMEFSCPGEKDRANSIMQLARVLVGTTRTYVKYWLFNVRSRPNAWVQAVKKLTMMAFRHWSKLVAGDTQGRWSLVAEGSNMHRIEALLSLLYFQSHRK